MKYLIRDNFLVIEHEDSVDHIELESITAVQIFNITKITHDCNLAIFTIYHVFNFFDLSEKTAKEIAFLATTSQLKVSSHEIPTPPSASIHFVVDSVTGSEGDDDKDS